MARGVAVAVLTWRSPRTLERSLRSYQRFGLDRLVDERLVLVQEHGKDEAAIAESFGWRVLLEDTNVGIGPAYRRLVNSVAAEVFLFLECDWRLLMDPRTQLAASRRVLEEESADLVRLRSVRRPGFPLGALRLQNREQLHPGWLIESIFYDPAPWRTFSEIKQHVELGVPFALARSAHAEWTNNPHLASTRLLRNLLARCGDAGDLETNLTSAWLDLDATVAHAPGLFTHDRVDGPAINARGLRYRADQRVRWWTRSLRRRMGAGTRPQPDGRR